LKLYLVVGNYNIHCISLLFSVAISPGLYNSQVRVLEICNSFFSLNVGLENAFARIIHLNYLKSLIMFLWVILKFYISIFSQVESLHYNFPFSTSICMRKTRRRSCDCWATFWRGCPKLKKESCTKPRTLFKVVQLEACAQDPVNYC